VRGAREDVRAAIGGLIEANLDTRFQFEENERLLRDSLHRVEAGETIRSILRSLPAEEERTANIESVRTYYERRHELRRATIRAALDEGVPADVLAALYAVTHEVIASCAASGTPPSGR
jgi:hypothetical protein